MSDEAAWLEELRAALAADRPLRRRWPWGRLHLDRSLPFLCLYRRPAGRPDAGTARLVRGEAAYLTVTARTEPETVAACVRLIAEAALRRFDGFLLLELWSEAEAPPHGGPAFTLHARRQDPPMELLETLEAALLPFRLRGRRAQVARRYDDWPHPPGQPPVRLELTGLVPLGLSLRPVYRDPDSGRLYPFALAHLHRHLTQALRQAFFVFAHRHSRHRPRHPHQLGPRQLDRVARQVDRGLAEIAGAFDLLLHVTPINAPAAWEAFRASGCQRAPTLLYRPRDADPALLKRRLYALPLEAVEDPALHYLLQAKRDELDRQLTLYGDRGTPRFLAGSRALFGEVDDALAQLAETILARLPPTGGGGGEALAPEAVLAAAREELARYRARDPGFASEARLQEDVSGILVSRGHFLIGPDARVPRARLAAALAHEIGTHCLTHHNGGRQPLAELQVGMAGYEPLQEGLAVLAEYLVGGLEANRLRQLAARVLAVRALYDGADFVETFRLLRARGQGPRAAFTTTLRVFRGGGYGKDLVYLRGLTALLDYLGGGGELEPLLLGKVALEFVPLVEELRWRGVLAPPALWPHHLEAPQAAARLARLRRGIGVLDLLEDSP